MNPTFLFLFWQSELWDGARIGPNAAGTMFGVDEVYAVMALPEKLLHTMADIHHVLYDPRPGHPHHASIDSLVQVHFTLFLCCHWDTVLFCFTICVCALCFLLFYLSL